MTLDEWSNNGGRDKLRRAVITSMVFFALLLAIALLVRSYNKEPPPTEIILSHGQLMDLTGGCFTGNSMLGVVVDGKTVLLTCVKDTK